MCAKKYTQNTDHIFFSFFYSNPKQRPLGGSYFVYVMMLCYYLTVTKNKTDDAGQKNDDGQKDDGEEEGGSDQTSQD